MRKPDTRQGFLSLLALSAKNYFQFLKPSLIFILALVLVKDIGLFFYDQPETWLAQFLVDGVIGLLLVYFWSCSLLAMDNFLLGQSVPANKVMMSILQLFPRIFVSLLIFVAIFVFFFMLGEMLLKDYYVLGLAVLTLPVLFLFVLLFFTIPNIILHQASLWVAFRESAEMVGFQNWLYAFALYAFALLTWLLVSPSTWHEHFLAQYYLNFVADFILLSLFLPMLNAMIVYSDNELRIS
jgi:hypothetical protein